MEYYNTNVSLLIKNCTFKYIMQSEDNVVAGRLPNNNVTVWFKNCKFYYNDVENLDLFIISIYVYIYLM